MPAKAGIHDFLAAAGELTKVADGIADQYTRRHRTGDGVCALRRQPQGD